MSILLSRFYVSMYLFKWGVAITDRHYVWTSVTFNEFLVFVQEQGIRHTLEAWFCLPGTTPVVCMDTVTLWMKSRSVLPSAKIMLQKVTMSPISLAVLFFFARFLFPSVLVHSSTGVAHRGDPPCLSEPGTDIKRTPYHPTIIVFKKL